MPPTAKATVEPGMNRLFGSFGGVGISRQLIAINKRCGVFR
jgi:hypothetical protein